MALTTEGGRCQDYEDMAGELLETHTGLGCRVESLLCGSSFPFVLLVWSCF
jgi:hypothetical protein